MFDLIPFDKKERNIIDYFKNIEKTFFGNMPSFFADFKTDILDKGDHYILEAELPGFDKKDIHIEINGDYLYIKAEHNTELEEKNERYLRQERSFSSFSRSFNISDVKSEEIKADLNNCVLSLKLPKSETTQKAIRKIDIN